MQEFSVPRVVQIDAATNLTDLVWDNAEQAPETVQFSRRTPDGWGEVTCATFRDEVSALARGLIAAGIQPGDRVGLMSKTRYEWTLVDFAIWAAGAITVPIYETSSAEQVQWILADSGALAVVVETAAHEATVAQVRDRVPDLNEVWQIDSGALDRLVASGAAVPDGEVGQRRHSAGADDPATIIYTSGTTGRPKGCVLTHRNLYADAASAVAVLPELFGAGAATLLFLPLAHSFARVIQNAVIRARCRMGHSPDIKNLVADLGEFQPTFILAVPRVFEKVYNGARQRAHADGKGAIFDRADRVAVAHSQARERKGGPGLALRLEHALFDRLVYGKLRAALGGRCAAAISGGAPLGTRLAHFFRGIGVTVLEGYGLTETSPAIAVNRYDATRIGTVGRPLPGVTVRVSDDGEILAKGEIVFSGYWNDEDATNDVLDGDGWFHTGDLGALDDDGYLRITGRKKEIIVTAGGKNVAPAVLEDRVRAHPLVSQCIVVGDRQPFIAALVTIDEEAWPKWLAEQGRPAGSSVADLRSDEALRTTIQQAVDEANQAVSRAEAIRVFRILPRDWSEETGELTPSLKVKRNVVLREHADEIAAIYA
ncbi:MAG: long-chain fatty acid--CoA ligase [Actinobacteria bacterium 13_1_20CM_3_71_11]|nr:MAG: long-chain fatty acid--CoA ligase [Actinobacteria bacterium 13_1_20CM_3_71_11]TML32321.1 MAG: long-chain fatty acid--CoA ligase [Actinomycetota bacterium]